MSKSRFKIQLKIIIDTHTTLYSSRGISDEFNYLSYLSFIVPVTIQKKITISNEYFFVYQN